MKVSSRLGKRFMKLHRPKFAHTLLWLLTLAAADTTAAERWQRRGGTIIMRHPVTDAGIKEVSGQSGVTNLSLDSGFDSARDRYTNVSLAPLARMTTLRSLNLSYREVKDAELLHLSTLTNLESLNLMSTPVSARGLAVMKSFPRLRHLALNDTKTSDKGLAQLAGLASLTWLNLDGTSVSDAGLAHLSRMKKLKTLHIVGTRVTPAGLAALQSLPALENLQIGVEGLKPEVVASLKRLPTLKRLKLDTPHGGQAGLAEITANRYKAELPHLKVTVAYE